ncbi:MAG: hypothetical protein Q8M16_03120 [Pirellulaceae bacterium]|nr:hypothetical protein [Pirellulaceae bacterium]
MPGVSRRADDNQSPYGKSKAKIHGVRKAKELIHQGWKITLLHRDQGVQFQRIAYSARVADTKSKTSFYVPCADSQKLVIKNAKKLIDQRIERLQLEKSKFYTVEKVLNLWFRDEDDPAAPATTPSIGSETTPLPE